MAVTMRRKIRWPSSCVRSALRISFFTSGETAADTCSHQRRVRGGWVCSRPAPSSGWEKEVCKTGQGAFGLTDPPAPSLKDAGVDGNSSTRPAVSPRSRPAIGQSSVKQFEGCIISPLSGPSGCRALLGRLPSVRIVLPANSSLLSQHECAACPAHFLLNGKHLAEFGLCSSQAYLQPADCFILTKSMRD
jgi:hypothetical protein